MTIWAIRDYRDGLRYKSRFFYGYPRHLGQGRDIRLGLVVFHVRETLVVRTTATPPIGDTNHES